MNSTKLFLFGLVVFAGSVSLANAQNVLASKTVSINGYNVVNSNAAPGWIETYGSGPSDLMIVKAPVIAGSKLQVCFIARAITPSGQNEPIYFGLAMHASNGTLLDSVALPGIGAPPLGGTTSYSGGTCYLWSPPISDTLSFHLLTWNNYQPSIAWFATRQIYVVQLR